MPSGSSRRPGCRGSRCSRATAFLTGHDLLHALGLHERERGGELAHAEVQSRDAVVGLAVVAKGARELEHVVAPRHEHAALPRRDRLGRVEGVHARVTPRPRAPAVPLGAVRVGAVLDQEDPLGGAQLRDLLHLEGDVAADVHEERGLGPVAAQLRLDVAQRGAQVVAVAVDEDRPPARREDRQRRGHEGVRRAQHGLAAHAGELERRQRAAGPRRRSRPRRRRSRPPTPPRSGASSRPRTTARNR